MPIIMFKVGDTDFSANVIDTTNGYKVQSDPVYSEWTDANGRDHRSIYRYRTSGSFTMMFKTMEDFESFCLKMDEFQKNDSSYPCVVYDNNKSTQVVSDFFVSYTPIRHRADDWSDYMAAITVTIKEC